MKYSKMFCIDFITHYRLRNTSTLEYKLSDNEDDNKLIIQNNYKSFLQRVKIGLLDEAVVYGLFDKPVKVSFQRIPYSDEEKEKALYYLESEAILSKGIAPMYARSWAKEKYEEYDPFNMLIVAETEEDENEIH